MKVKFIKALKKKEKSY